MKKNTIVYFKTHKIVYKMNNYYLPLNGYIIITVLVT